MKPRPDAKILEAFWPLSDGIDSQRIASVVSITCVLDEKQNAVDDGLSTDLDYVLTRLVRGLASDRQLARQGFAVALTQVLRRYEEISMEHIFQIIKENLKISSKERNAEKANTALGQVTAYLACIQSGKIFSASGKEVSAVVKELLSWSRSRPALSLLCMEAISLIIAKVSKKTFTKHVWKLLESPLAVGWQECTPDTLLLVLKVVRFQNTMDTEFLAKHWGSASIVCEKHFDDITQIFMKSTEDHPIIHTVCTEVMTLAMKDIDLFRKFWQHIINDKLMTAQAGKRYLGFNLTMQALKHTSTVEQVEVILSPGVVSCLVGNLAQQRVLHGVAKQLLSELSSFVEGCENGKVQVAVILALLRDPGSIQFDNITKTHTISNMMTTLRAEGAEDMAAMLIEVMTGKPLLGGLDVSDMIVTRKWALPHLRNLVTNNSKSMDTEWQLGILKFLFLHAFFDVKDEDPDILHCQRLRQSFDSVTQSNLQEAFFKALDNLAEHRHQGAALDQQQEKRLGKDPRLFIEVVYKIVQYGQLLLTKSDSVELHSPMKDKAMIQWKVVIEKVEKIREKVTMTTAMGEGHAFQLLFLQLGLQLFTDPKNAIDVLQELSVCYDKSCQKKRRKSVKKEDLEEPHWVEVVTELLLSLLSQPSHLMRVVVGNVFKMLVPVLTDQSVQLILDVFELSGSEEEEEGPLAFQDDNEDEDEEDMEEGKTECQENDCKTDCQENDCKTDCQKNGKTEEENADNEESESSEDESGNDEENIDVDESFRSSVKAALGEAAESSDDESDSDDNDNESDSDMSDGAMERIDTMLSQAFRSMYKGKAFKKEQKVKKLQLRDFKLRCLDLLHNLVRQSAPASTLTGLLVPMLTLMQQGLRDKSQKMIADKATDILQILCKSKKVYVDVSLDKLTLPDLIRELLQLSTKDTGILLMKEISISILFVVRLMLGMEHDSGPSPLKTRSRSNEESKEVKQKKEYTLHLDEFLSVIRQTMAEYFEKRDSRYNHLLFHELIKRQPALMWPLTRDLLQYINQPSVRKFCRAQACTMIRTLMTKSTCSEIGDEQWKAFMREVQTEISKALLGVSKTDLSPKYLEELLLLFFRCNDLSRGAYKFEFSEEVLDNVSSLHSVAKNDSRRSINRFLTVTGNRNKRKVDDTDDGVKSKKKKKEKKTQTKWCGQRN